MTVAAFKAYLKSLKFSGVAADPAQQEIVDAAAEAAFGKVWEAHVWKIGKKIDTSKTTTASQAHTILPNDLSGVGNISIVSGTNSRRISILGDGNFDDIFPNPAALATAMPSFAKIVYNSAAANNRWRVYWDRLPDAAYTLNITYRFMADIGYLPHCPGHMLEPMMLVASTLILPPGPTQNNQMAAAQASLNAAIKADENFVGVSDPIGGDPGWDDWSTVSSGGSVWDPR